MKDAAGGERVSDPSLGREGLIPQVEVINELAVEGLV